MPGISDLMSALATDKSLSEKLTEASSPDAAVEIAKAAGYQITSAELMEAYKTKMASMSEEELANVAGGKGDSSKKSDTSYQGSNNTITYTNLSGQANGWIGLIQLIHRVLHGEFFWLLDY